MAIRLRDDEKVVHRSWVSYVILFETFAIFLVGVLLDLVFSGDGAFISIGWLLFIVIDAVKVYLQYRRTRIVLTNQRLLAKYGAFFSEEVAIELDELSSVIVSQGYVGRWFNYGTITINTKSGRYYAISTIYKPAELKAAIK